MRLELNNYEWRELRPRLYVTSLLAVDFTPLSDGLTSQACAQMRGHWAAIEVTEAGVRVAMDPVRSFPIFWTVAHGALWVSDDFMLLHEKFPAPMGPAARELLSFTGFTGLERTFNKNVSLAQGGAITEISEHGNSTVTSYRDLAFGEEKFVDEVDFIAALGDSFDRSLDALIADNPNGNFVIPLSGGFDSRLFAVYLARKCPERIRCFTYGIPGATEVQVSKKVADQLGLTWRSMDLTAGAVAKLWDRPDTAEFLAYASSGSALPHVQDYFALRVLLDEGYIAQGDIVLPGHTVVGNLWDTALLDADLPTIIQSAWEHQGGLRKAKPHQETLDLFAEDFRAIVSRHGTPQTRRDRQRVCELHNLVSRQTRYINNSMRAYEFLGLRWALPCLEAPFTDTWFAGAVEFTAERAVYRRWIDAEFAKEVQAKATPGQQPDEKAEANAESASPEYYAAKGVSLPTQLVSKIKPLAKAIGIDRAYWGMKSRQTIWRHPLGFELYLNNYPEWKRALKTAQGIGSLSLWMEQLLTDTWHPQLKIFTRDN